VGELAAAVQSGGRRFSQQAPVPGACESAVSPAWTRPSRAAVRRLPPPHQRRPCPRPPAVGTRSRRPLAAPSLGQPAHPTTPSGRCCRNDQSTQCRGRRRTMVRRMPSMRISDRYSYRARSIASGAGRACAWAWIARKRTRGRWRAGPPGSWPRRWPSRPAPPGPDGVARRCVPAAPPPRSAASRPSLCLLVLCACWFSVPAGSLIRVPCRRSDCNGPGRRR